MKKVEARSFFKKQRIALTTYQVNVAQDLLLIRLQELELPYMNIVHSYLPLYAHNEPDPSPLIDWLRFSDPGIQVVYPKINEADFSMQHILQDDDTSVSLNQYGIPEPVGGQ